MLGLWLEQANRSLLGEKGKGIKKYLDLRRMAYMSNKGGRKLEMGMWR